MESGIPVPYLCASVESCSIGHIRMMKCTIGLIVRVNEFDGFLVAGYEYESRFDEKVFRWVSSDTTE